MNRRLQQFLAVESISQSQFAERIGVAKASVSHILAGRNKPGFDFIEGIARHFPNLNIEWLITGKGRMYKGSPVSAPPEAPEVSQEAEIPPREVKASRILDSREPTLFADSPEPADIQPQTAARTISKICVFYTDGTFREIF